MPKGTRASRRCSRLSPYYRCSDDPNHVEYDLELGSPEDVEQWEETRCPICLDHPHNALLLRCSSFDNGCRPYVCNTGVRHSNCLDQFCKLPASSPSAIRPRMLHQLNSALESGLQHQLRCPLCRGEILGWSVVEAARKLMNSKPRSCSWETCDFVGNFAELRRHARSEHPCVRPSEVDPERIQNWIQMEHQSYMTDLTSMNFDHSPNNLEDLSIANSEEELPSLTEEEEEEEERNESVNDLYYVYLYGRIRSSAPTNTFTIPMNTANGEDNFRQGNSSTANISPAMLGGRDSLRYTLNIILETPRWIHENGRRELVAVVRLTDQLRPTTVQVRLQLRTVTTQQRRTITRQGQQFA